MPIVSPLNERDYPGGRALVVLHTGPDGCWPRPIVEIYGTRALSAHVAIMPYVEHEATRDAVEELFLLRLPKPFRDIYWPGYLRGSELIHPVTITDLYQRSLDVELLKSLDSLKEACRPNPPLKTEQPPAPATPPPVNEVVLWG